MNTIPNETEAAEVAATVDELERGLTQLSLAKGINRIDDWRRKLMETERTDLMHIGNALGELHQALVGERIDGARVSSILVRLGEQTEAASNDVSPSTTGDSNEELKSGLKRLASLLRHAGGALGGAPSPSDA